MDETPNTPAPAPLDRTAADRLAAVLEIGQLLGSTLDLDALLELVMAGITRLLEAERATLFLRDEATGELWSKVALGEGVVIRVPDGQGLAGHVVKTGETVRVADAYSDVRFLAEVDRATGFRTRSLLAVPLRGKQGVIVGVAQALNRVDGRAFDEADERTFVAMANVVGIALENAQLYQSLRTRNDELDRTQERLRRKVAEVDLLFAVEREVSQASGVDAFVDVVLGRVLEAMQVGAGAVWLGGDGQAGMLHARLAGRPGPADATVALPASGAARTAFEEGRAAWGVSSAALEQEGVPQPGSLVRLAGGAGRSVVAAPLVAQDRGGRRVIGVLELSDPVRAGAHDLGPDDASLVSLLGDQLGRAVHTLQQRGEQERAERLAALGQVLGGVVHDLRTPMTVISGYAELMAREESASTREEFTQTILTQIDHVTSMTREVLAFVRGERALLARRVLLSSLWKELSGTVMAELSPRGMRLESKLDYAGAARVDEAKIRRLVTNLARNAAQAMGPGGRFSMSCAAHGDALVLTFADTGPGLPPKVAARLFTAFNTQGKADGTGLGLAIVREAVAAHGGSIDFESKPGEGTTFVVRLPGAIER